MDIFRMMKGTLCKHYGGIDGFNCISIDPNGFIKAFNSINEKYFYIRYPETNTTNIFDKEKWVNNPLTIMNKMDTQWFVEDDGLYVFKVETVDTKVFKYSLDGKNLLWTQSLPYCYPRYPDSQLLLSATTTYVFVVCNSETSIYQLRSKDGELIYQYPLEKGNVKTLECSDSFLFILFDTSNVVQYTFDFYYVFTYKVPFSGTPKYNSIKLDEKYLFYVLCSDNTEGEYCKSVLHM
jgi:hypothetical protein